MKTAAGAGVGPNLQCPPDEGFDALRIDQADPFATRQCPNPLADGPKVGRFARPTNSRHWLPVAVAAAVGGCLPVNDVSNGAAAAAVVADAENVAGACSEEIEQLRSIAARCLRLPLARGCNRTEEIFYSANLDKKFLGSTLAVKCVAPGGE